MGPGKKPTVVLLDASGPAGGKTGPFWSYMTAGTMNAIAVSSGQTSAGQVAYYVGTAGCTTLASCTEAGAEAFLFEVTGM
jgi:hypothetical protein